MKEPSETKHSNPDNVPTERNSKTKEKNNEFEFCKVCKLNHNQGRRHNYLPNHVKSLSSFLSRFQSKLSDVRLFLKNPSSIRPELAFRNRFWCVFCDIDVTEHGSSFACENGISHLASADHLKNLKSFMWKHGGGMNRVNAFRISEADLAKYEKKCISMKNKGASEQSRVPLTGPSNDIHNELKFDYVDNFDRSHNSKFPNGVLPLQNHTNENYQVFHSDLPGGYHDKSFLLASDAKPSNNSTAKSFLNEGYLNNRQREADTEASSAGFQKLTRISSIVQEVGPGNVHSGAPPPWFGVTNGSQLDCVVKRRKSKLNPKRVGAEWAERRKMEMEMERKGELPAKQFDASWLPNFGRVWQSGSRKDSRKEFKVVETDKSFKDDEVNQSHDSSLLQLQPYISKRKRQEANE
ncbi:hypothetical protein LXL04_031943 [Taraxacum kok-saghyz]